MPKNKSPPLITKLVIQFTKPVSLDRILERLTNERREELTMCPMVDSELNDAAIFTLVPKGIYNGQVVAKQDKTSQGGAPMAVIDWQITAAPNNDPQFIGRKVRYDNIMLGGLSKDKKPLNLGQLCSFLHYTGIPWRCKHCSTNYAERHSFLIAKAEDCAEGSGLKIGNFYCPNCKNPKPAIVYDTDDFMGASCGIGIGSSKGLTGDKEFNNITGYTDMLE